MMKVFVGVESTAHTFGVGVLDLEGRVLANEREQFVTSEGGMIPVEVRAHHERVGEEVWERALEKVAEGVRGKEKGVSGLEVVGIGFSNAPGLAPCLLAGMEFVKGKAKDLGVEVVEVNHCVAHLVIGEKFGTRDAVMLYVSGANTQVVGFEGGRFRVFGETLDLGVGNFIDTVGRMMGLGFPAGPRIEKLASEYEESELEEMKQDGQDGEGEEFGKREQNSTRINADECGLKKEKPRICANLRESKKMFPELLELPYVVKGMDVSLSGVQTRIRVLLERGENKGKVAYALQETVFAMLVEVAERALAHTGKRELLIGGGVGCNGRLVEMCRIMCEERGCRLIVPDKEFLVDNGGMIGYLGLKMFEAGLGKGVSEVDIRPRERTDEVVCDF